MAQYNYFSDDEFKRCCPPCSLSDMSPSFMEKLDYVREVYGFPIIVNSAYRTKEWEHSKGRTGTSSHCLGVAVDIKCTDSFLRLKLLRSLLSAGFTRIGIGATFVHVDADYTKPDALWLYE